MPPGPICAAASPEVAVSLVSVLAVSEAASAVAASPSSTVVEPEALMPSSVEVRSIVPPAIVMSPPSRASFDCVTVTFAPSRTAATSVWTPSSPEAAVMVPELRRRAPLEWMASSPESTSMVPPSTMTYVDALIPLAEPVEGLPLAAPPPEVIDRVPPVTMASVEASMPSPPEVRVRAPPEMFT